MLPFLYYPENGELWQFTGSSVVGERIREVCLEYVATHQQQGSNPDCQINNLEP